MAVVEGLSSEGGDPALCPGDRDIEWPAQSPDVARPGFYFASKSVVSTVSPSHVLHCSHPSKHMQLVILEPTSQLIPCSELSLELMQTTVTECQLQLGVEIADGHVARFDVRSLGVLRELRFLGAPRA